MLNDLIQENPKSYSVHRINSSCFSNNEFFYIILLDYICFFKVSYHFSIYLFWLTIIEIILSIACNFSSYNCLSFRACVCAKACMIAYPVKDKFFLREKYPVVFHIYLVFINKNIYHDQCPEFQIGACSYYLFRQRRMK